MTVLFALRYATQAFPLISLGLFSILIHLNKMAWLAVSIRFYKRCYRHAMWTHYPSKLLEGDERSLSVSVQQTFFAPI